MKVGIVGAGTMGCGIAQAFAAIPDYTVVLSDVSLELASKGMDKIAAKLNKTVEKGRMEAEEAAKIKNSIKPGERRDLLGCDLIIEAALEDMRVKKELFLELATICGPETMFATNTSSLSITDIGYGLDRPLVGMHFFNPAETMKLVEIIPGLNTPDETVERLRKIAVSIGKTPVLVRDSAGFVVNRILIPMINEAVGILSEGAASAEDIDTAMRLGAGHPMGPLALGDLIGLDVCLAIMEVLHSELGEDKYRPHQLLRKMVRGGLLGRKSGRGFLDYSR